MKMKVNTQAEIEIDIDSHTAFEALCKTLDMDFVLENEGQYYITKDEEGENQVCFMKDGHDEVYDERGDLFIALSNVMVQISLSHPIRGEDYIYNY